MDVPVPIPAQNPCRSSWNWMEDDIQRLMIPDIAFHRTSTIPTPLKLLPPPLEIITTVFQAHITASYPPLKAAYMMAKTFSQFPGLGCSSHFAARSHNLRCLAVIPDGPPAQCIRSCITVLEIPYSPRILLSTGKGATLMGTGILEVGHGRRAPHASTSASPGIYAPGGGGVINRIPVPPAHPHP